MTPTMASTDWLTAMRRRAIPDHMLIEAEKLIVAKDKIIASLVERCGVQSEVIGKRAEKATERNEDK